MQKVLFVQPIQWAQGDTEQSRVRWIQAEDGKSLDATAGQGSLADASALVDGCKVIALLPSTDILLTQASLPTSNRKRMLKAIPYALEEQLISNVDQQHFAIGEQQEDGSVPVAVVSKDSVETYLSEFRQAGIEPDAFMPDVLLLPYEQDAWWLWNNGKYAMLRTGTISGFSVDHDNRDLMLELAFNQEEQAPSEIHVIDVSNNSDELENITSICKERDIRCDIHKESLDFLQIAARTYNGKSGVNLLQGIYTKPRHMGKIWKAWRPAAILFVVWIVAHLALLSVDYFRLSGYSTSAKQEIEQIYLDVFPGSRVVNPRAQMEQRINASKGGDQGGVERFLGMLSDLGDAMRTAGSAEMRRIRYKDGTMDVDMSIKNVQILEQFKQKLISDAGLKVEILSANVSGDKTEARMQVKE